MDSLPPPSLLIWKRVCRYTAKFYPNLQSSCQYVALNPLPEMFSSEKNRTVMRLETLVMIGGGTLPQKRPEKPCKISSDI